MQIKYSKTEFNKMSSCFSGWIMNHLTWADKENQPSLSLCFSICWRNKENRFWFKWQFGETWAHLWNLVCVCVWECVCTPVFCHLWFLLHICEKTLPNQQICGKEIWSCLMYRTDLFLQTTASVCSWRNYMKHRCLTHSDHCYFISIQLCLTSFG